MDKRYRTSNLALKSEDPVQQIALTWAAGNALLAFSVAMIGQQWLFVSPWPRISGGYSALCWFLLYLWLVGLAWRTRSLPVAISLLFFIFAGVFALLKFITVGGPILISGLPGALAFLSVGLAIFFFWRKSEVGQIRIKMALPGLLFLFGGGALLLKDVLIGLLGLLLDSLTIPMLTPDTVMWTAVALYYCMLALLLSAYPFRTFFIERFR